MANTIIQQDKTAPTTTTYLAITIQTWTQNYLKILSEHEKQSITRLNFLTHNHKSQLLNNTLHTHNKTNKGADWLNQKISESEILLPLFTKTKPFRFHTIKSIIQYKQPSISCYSSIQNLGWSLSHTKRKTSTREKKFRPIIT